MLLLSVAGVALGTSTRALAILADDAALVARAHAAGSTLAEQVHWRACAASVTRSDDLSRVHVEAVSTRDSAAVRATVLATLAPSPLARSTTRSLSLSTGRLCQ
ncbi:MAG: hypothetical protein V4617_13015 [Gemmatimonadota bacterium]